MDIALLRKLLLEAYARLEKKGGWRAVGAVYGVSGAMAYRIANNGYEPKDAGVRARLGLPSLQQVVATGSIHPGTIIDGDDRKCANPECPNYFMPRVWNKRCCSKACKNQLRRLMRKAKTHD